MAEPSTDRVRFGACNNCRRKKQKCGLEKPECVRCRTSKLLCVYPTSKKKPGPRKGSVPSRMAALQDRLGIAGTQPTCTTSGADNLPGRLESLLKAHDIATSSGDEISTSKSNESERKASVSSDFGAFDLPVESQLDPEPFDTSSESSPNFDSPEFEAQHDSKKMRRLLDLYFSTIQPTFPLFRQAQFAQDLANNAVPKDLITIMMSLAARFSSIDADDQDLISAVNRIEHKMEKKDLDYRNIKLNEIRLACLCIVHQFASSPSQKTWMNMGKLSRVVYASQLHQVDSVQGNSYFPGASREELRYVWWTAVRIDSFCNLLSCTPFSLEVDTAATSFMMTSVAEFTSGVEPDPSLRHIPRTNSSAYRAFIADPNNAIQADGQALQLAMILLLRDTARQLRSSFFNPDDPTAKETALGIQNNCMKIFSTLPEWYLDLSLATQFYETPIRHRSRLEALMQFRLCCIYSLIPAMVALNSELPTDPSAEAEIYRLWDIFVSHLQSTVDIFRAMPQSYYPICDPMLSSCIWILGCMISLCLMNQAPLLNDSIQWSSSKRLEADFTVVMESLAGFAKTWPLAKKLLESLESVRGWHSLPLTLSEVLELLKRLQVPFPIHETAPESIYDFDVLGTCKVSLDQPMDQSHDPSMWWPIQ